jgi:hypothetical protein
MGNTISGLSNYLRTVLPDIFHRFLPSVSRDRVSSFGQLSCVIVLVFSSYFGGMRLSVSEYTETILPKGPTLIYTGDNTRMRIFWQWSSNATFQVQWGTSAAYELGDAAVDPMDTTNNLYTYDITGLTPGIRYYYRLVTGSQSSDGTFYAAPPSNATSVKFIAYGDTRTNGSKHNELAGQVVSLYQSDPGFQTFNLHVGDWVSNDSESAWTSEWFAPGYANLRTQDANLTRLGVRGNHEGGATYWKKYWPEPFSPDGLYWSFDYGPLHVVMLDQYTAYGAGSTQYNWLVADLAASNKPWKVVVLHEPGWSAGGGHANNTTVQNDLQPLFLQYGVSIVFGGHNHYYARANVNGVMHLTLGGGGAPLNMPVPGQPYIVSSNPSYSFGQFTVSGNTLTAKIVNDTGTTIDTFSLASPSLCPGANKVPSYLFVDDLEAGAGNWDFGSDTGSWDRSTSMPISGSYSLFWAGVDSVDRQATLVNNAALPSGKTSYLYFEHRFDFNYEPAGNLGYDGGVLEYSTDGGTTWQDIRHDAKNLFSAGQDYNMIMAPTGSALADRPAFSGSSGGTVASRYDLSTLAGQNVRFRWRAASDSMVPSIGWRVDNVRIYTCNNKYVPNDFDGDGKTDPAKFTGSGNLWYKKSSTGAWEGKYLGADGIYVRGSDFDGDGKTDPAKFVAGTVWYIKSSTGTWESKFIGADGTYVPGVDLDGDGKTDPAKFVSGNVWYLKSSTGTIEGVYIGSDGQFVSGSDFDGDGKSDLAKYVSSAGAIWYRKSSTGTWEGKYIGSDGTYVSGSDFDGDGKSDPAKFVSSAGAIWYLQSSTGTWVGKFIGSDGVYVSGTDFDGDGNSDPAKFVSSSGSAWYLKSSTATWEGQYIGSDGIFVSGW